MCIWEENAGFRTQIWECGLGDGRFQNANFVLLVEIMFFLVGMSSTLDETQVLVLNWLNFLYRF